jgi:DNA-binding LacI/PurR family transcriptional regulator
VVKYVATDNYKGGQLAAKHLLELLARRQAVAAAVLRAQVGSEHGAA